MTPVEQAVLPAAAVRDGVADALGGWERIQMLLADKNNLIILALIGLGVVLKKSNKVPDWLITFLVPGIGGILGYGLFCVTFHETQALPAFLLGFVYGVFAVFAHQISKQILESPYGQTLLKIPGVSILAALTGVDPASEVKIAPPAKDPMFPPTPLPDSCKPK